jgi:hypothetical protein
MPLFTIKTGFSGADGREEVLTEYLCDWPGCANPAVHTLGCITSIRAMARVCEAHVPPSKRRMRHSEDDV